MSDPDAALRALLAGALLEPSPEQLRRWQTALDDVAAPVAAPVTGPTPTPSARSAGHRRFSARTVTIGLAAAAVVAAWVGVHQVTGPQDRPLNLTREQVRTTLPAGRDFGELADPGSRAACLARTGAAGLEPLAGRPVLLDGRPGVLLVLPSDRPGRLRVLVVGPTCADTLADATTG